MTLYHELTQRGLIDQITSDELIEELNKNKLKFYVGFDPTADSLHIGQLAVFNLMRWLQDHGHQPIVLMGAATGMIGDPSGKSNERNLMSQGHLEANIERLKPQFTKFLPTTKETSPLFVNNYDWLGQQALLEFLRGIGKNFPVNQMLARESVASRLSRQGEGISFTEFSYMVLQAYDFLHLYQNYDCTLQLGGSDQWGNILAGLDLIRRLEKTKVYGMTMPLVTKFDGSKFGKSEKGTVWLTADKTSPYQLYQFLLRQADRDVIRLLKMLTQLDLKDIDRLEKSTAEQPHLRDAQHKLADEVTKHLHGEEEWQLCKKASQSLFGGSLDQLDPQTLTEVFQEVPSFQLAADKLSAGWEPLQALVEIGACKSKGEARRLIQSGGFYVNNQIWPESTALTQNQLLHQDTLVLRTGKKNYYLIKLEIPG